MKKTYGVMEVLKAWMVSLRLALWRAAEWIRGRLYEALGIIKREAMEPQPGIDGILVTVGLCIIALLLCVVMKNSLSTFIESIVASMKKEATNILSGART